jgi:hypothetical protein
MICSQIFHQILSYPSCEGGKKKKIKSENFNNSENNVISVKLAQVLQYPLY